MKNALTFTGTLLLAITVARPFAVQPAPTRLALELQDYAALPVTADNTNTNTRAQLARVNFMRDEPGGRRFFVNDLNGPLYILDKQKKTFTTYLDFNGRGGRPGLFPKFTFELNFATGLTNFIFDPDYAKNGVFYTLHMEDPATDAPAAPKAGAVAGLDLTGYTTTPAIPTPTVEGQIEREVVLIEWKDRNPANTTFEGTARELLRLQHPMPIHPLGEMTFNPAARPGDPDWRVMYLGAGDSGSGEQRDSRRLNPQRLDTLVGKILRIVPDLGEHTKTSTVSENGRYRIPNDNPFATIGRRAQGDLGVRLAQSASAGLGRGPGAARRTPTLLAFNIGLVTWETVVVIHKGANYGYPLREGTQSMSSTNGMGPDTRRRHDPDSDLGHGDPRHGQADLPGDPVSAQPGGWGRRDRQRVRLPRQVDPGAQGQARLRRHHHRAGSGTPNRAEVLAADDGNPTTVAPIHEMDAGLRRITEETYRERGGKGRGHSRNGRGCRTWPRRRAVCRGQRRGALRPDQERRRDQEGRGCAGDDCAGAAPRRAAGQNVPSACARPEPASSGGQGQPAANLKNPVASTPESIAAGKRAYDTNCAPCHGNLAQGAVKAGMTISIIEEQKGKQPPDLTDEQWDHGSSDGDIYAVIKRGLPPTMMAGYDGRIPDNDIWSIVNYLRSLAPQKPAR